MHPQGWRIAVPMLAALAVAATPAFGQGIGNPLGRPQIVVGPQPSLYVWADQTGWHVRWANPTAIILSGTVTTDGQFNTACPAGGAAPAGLSFVSGQQAVFTIPARSGIGGFDFQASGRYVTFNLGFAGLHAPGRVPPLVVVIGQTVFPSLRTFTLSAPPTVAAVNCREPYLSDVDRPATDR